MYKDNFYAFRGVEKVPCEKQISNQFIGGEHGGHFFCDDLLKDDPDALFFFIKESRTLDYKCISVCHGGVGFNIMSIKLVIVTFIVWVYI